MFNTASVQEPIQCTICLEENLKEGLGHDAKGVLHLFHDACLRRVVDESSAHCPLCREKITHIKDVPVPEKLVLADGLEHRPSKLEKCIALAAHCTWIAAVGYALYSGNWPRI